MPLNQAFRSMSVLLAGVSFLALVHGTDLPGWLVFLTGMALLVSFARAIGSTGRRSIQQPVLSATACNVLVLMGFFGFLMDGLASGELLPAGVRFLLVLMVIKLFNLRRTGDYLHLHAISVVMMVAAALGADPWYFLFFLAYLLIGVWALVLLGVTKQGEDLPVPASGLLPGQETTSASGEVTFPLLRTAGWLAAAVFGLTLVLFYALPRLQAGLYQSGQGTVIRTAGFSGSVDLGALGPIKQDPRIVMRVELPGRARGEKGLYLRGIAFDHYDGRSWVNQMGLQRAIHQTDLGIFSLPGRRSEDQLSPELFHQQRIFLEPLDTPVLFGTPFMEKVSGKLPAVQVDGGGSFYLPFPIAAPIEYVAVSRPPTVLPADLHPLPSAVHYHDAFLRYFTQVPHRSDRIAALARTVAQHARTPFEQAMAIRDHLSRHYRYSLELPVSDQAHPLEEFLFNRKTGYCEHYATAMTIMLRTLGVPARLVTGFLATEWNEYGRYYVVRQQDAHAWVEVYLPYSGWITMDPTPLSNNGGTDVGARAWVGWRDITDYLHMWWNRVVLRYSAADQIAIVRGVQVGSATVGRKVWESVSGWFNPPPSWGETIVGLYDRSTVVLTAGVIVVLTGLGLLLWSGQKQSRYGSVCSKGGIQGEKQVVTKLYSDMILYLSSKGIQKPVTTGPLQFLDTIRMQWADAFPLAATITELYCRGRFGNATLTSDEYTIARNKLRQLMSLTREQEG